jgi:hypothetical protein
MSNQFFENIILSHKLFCLLVSKNKLKLRFLNVYHSQMRFHASSPNPLLPGEKGANNHNNNVISPSLLGEGLGRGKL